MCEVAYEFRDLNNELSEMEKQIEDLRSSKKPITKVTATKKYKNTKLLVRALNQMARELLLAQSSDWLFIITNQTMVDYAHKRIKDHIGRFTKLYEQVKSNSIDADFLQDIEIKDAIFPDIDYRIYS